MSKSHLTHKYRPQSFKEVAGQDLIKAVLSRAAETQTIAPAYLFSGTRGVGKTTLARIFAKAINCENGPAAEPCNTCSRCRQIQAGVAVDVVEIDAASHTGVDNVRSLKETVGFAPLDGAYKVFIVDEAHMLSKGAFNALLKTLEEPPPHATFIMATTEPHKFPATIISRSQHYIFQRLEQKKLEKHLCFLLESESVTYEQEAVALLARRGSGSVRDAMSLLGQVLALGPEKLCACDVRNLLGLAGRDILFNLFQAIHAGDCIAVSRQLRLILDQGLDLGFFLRELTAGWRNLFLLAQAKDASSDVSEVLDVPEAELTIWQKWAQEFSPAHIHACWQLTLEGQQQVKNSIEPALALELLLLNLACLPRLLPLQHIAATGESNKNLPSGALPDIPEEKSGLKKKEPEKKPTQAPIKPLPQPEPSPPALDTTPKTWQGFLELTRKNKDLGQHFLETLQKYKVQRKEEKTLLITCPNNFSRDILTDSGEYHAFTQLISKYFGTSMDITFSIEASPRHVTKKDAEFMAKKHPVIQAVLSELSAGILDISPVKQK